MKIPRRRRVDAEPLRCPTVSTPTPWANAARYPVLSTPLPLDTDLDNYVLLALPCISFKKPVNMTNRTNHFRTSCWRIRLRRQVRDDIGYGGLDSPDQAQPMFNMILLGIIMTSTVDCPTACRAPISAVQVTNQICYTIDTSIYPLQGQTLLHLTVLFMKNIVN